LPSKLAGPEPSQVLDLPDSGVAEDRSTAAFDALKRSIWRLYEIDR
jgi:hypothetical protein